MAKVVQWSIINEHLQLDRIDNNTTRMINLRISIYQPSCVVHPVAHVFNYWFVATRIRTLLPYLLLFIFSLP